MEKTELYTLIALGVNTIALLVVLFQTWLTSKTKSVSERSTQIDKNVRYKDNLSNATLLLTVLSALERWEKELQCILDDLRLARKGNLDALRRASSKGRKTPAGLINKPQYDSSPRWLVEIWVAGAQYYYNCVCVVDEFWLDQQERPKYGIDQHFGAEQFVIERFEESIDGLRGLAEVIEDGLPESYMNSPASLKERQFLDR